MISDEFKIDTEALPEGVGVLALQGSLDAHTFERLEQTISAQFGKGCYKLVIDLAKVDYVSSAGAGVFIGALSEAQEHDGNIVLLNPTTNVQEVLDLLGLVQIFPIVQDRTQAIAALKKN